MLDTLIEGGLVEWLPLEKCYLMKDRRGNKLYMNKEGEFVDLEYS